ncbi:hypothetical protein DUNSADRAFT_4648, partial [Dunaliella salina]
MGCPLLEQSEGPAGTESLQPPPHKKQRQTAGGDRQSKQASTPAAQPAASNSRAATSSSTGATAAGAMLASAARVLVGGAAKAAPALCTGLVGHAAQVVMLWVPPEGVELQPEPSIEQQQQQQQQQQSEQQQREQKAGPSRRGRGGRGGRHGAAAAPAAGDPQDHHHQQQQQQQPHLGRGAELQGEQRHGGMESTEHQGAPPATQIPSLGALTAAVKVLANTMRAYIDAFKERGAGGGLPMLPHGLEPVLRALCVHSTPKVAKLAAFALAGVAEAQAVIFANNSPPKGMHTAERVAQRRAPAPQHLGGQGSGKAGQVAQQLGGHGSGKVGQVAVQEALQGLAEYLAGFLQQAVAAQEEKQRGRSKGKSGPGQGGEGLGMMRALCALQALGSVGCIAPQVFAEYVRDAAHFVNQVLLPAPIDQATASAALLPMELHAGGPSGPPPAAV